MTGRLVLMCAVLLPILAQATVIGAEDITLLQAGVVKITAKPPEGSHKVGTGFIVSIDKESVYIITAAHVVSGDPRPQVVFFPKRNVRQISLSSLYNLKRSSRKGEKGL